MSDATIQSGRLFVCGDIHGCVDQLMQELARIGFDKSRDHLIALGDLVDRGPKNVEAIALLDEPWFESILGNHEVLMMEAARGNAEMHVINGGAWFALLPEDERQRLAARVADLPICLTIKTASGRKIGFVHADFPGNDWDDFVSKVDTHSVQDYALWCRERVGRAKYSAGYEDFEPATNVDHVYFGHTPLKEPLDRANFSWIDTGCFATGRITVREVL